MDSRGREGCSDSTPKFFVCAFSKCRTCSYLRDFRVYTRYGYNPHTTADPNQVRGRCRLEECNELLDLLISRHRAATAATGARTARGGAPAPAPLSTAELARVGARVTGQTGASRLATLRCLKASGSLPPSLPPSPLPLDLSFPLRRRLSLPDGERPRVSPGTRDCGPCPCPLAPPVVRARAQPGGCSASDRGAGNGRWGGRVQGSPPASSVDASPTPSRSPLGPAGVRSLPGARPCAGSG